MNETRPTFNKFKFYSSNYPVKSKRVKSKRVTLLTIAEKYGISVAALIGNNTSEKVMNAKMEYVKHLHNEAGLTSNQIKVIIRVSDKLICKALQT